MTVYNRIQLTCSMYDRPIGLRSNRVKPKWVRPTTSIFERDVKRQYNVDASELDFYVGVSDFTKSGGRQTKIGPAFTKPRPPPETPGPGAYSPPAAPKETRFLHRMSDAGHQEIRAPMTTNIGYINARLFPRISSVTISRSNPTSFIQGNDMPSCQYTAPSELSKRSHRIAGKFKDDRPAGIPGPDRYAPSAMTKGPSFPLMGPKYRDDWMTDAKNAPAPTQYTPKKPLPGLPMFSIGDRSRTEAKSGTPFPVGPVISSLDDDVSVEEARQYVMAHPELKDVVNEILNATYKAKPEDPLYYLAHYFSNASMFSQRPRRLIVHKARQ